MLAVDHQSSPAAPGYLMRQSVCVLALLLSMTSTGCSSDSSDTSVPPPTQCTWTKHSAKPHDPKAFTQGLQWHSGFLYEGTGLYGESTLRKVEVDTGKVLMQRSLEKRFFGEGITIFGERIFQLTWREQTAFEYSLKDFSPTKRYEYAGEGWGLTHNGKALIMSDGTPEIRFIDPESFAELSRITVVTDRGPVPMLNELEFINGRIYANVWQTPFVVIINPSNGHVTGMINFDGLLDIRPAPGVLNGIAQIPNSDRTLITGKNWPFIFEVTIDCPR